MTATVNVLNENQMEALSSLSSVFLNAKENQIK